MPFARESKMMQMSNVKLEANFVVDAEVYLEFGLETGLVEANVAINIETDVHSE